MLMNIRGTRYDGVKEHGKNLVNIWFGTENPEKQPKIATNTRWTLYI